MKQLLYIISAAIFVLAACTKTEEPPKPIGSSIPYHSNASRRLVQIVDSLPEATLYSIAFHRSSIEHYMDSLNSVPVNTPDAPYTLFIPSDKAMAAAGYTKDIISSLSVASADTLVRYLSLPGMVRTDSSIGYANTTFVPLIPGDLNIQGSLQQSFYYPYYYNLTVGFSASSLLLNGKVVASPIKSIPATNGDVFIIDSLIQQPTKDMYELVLKDTSLTFYMAALRKSNELYAVNGTLDGGLPYNDTLWLQLQMPFGDVPGHDVFNILFAPDNNAFRKAGFFSINEIDDYIDKSQLASSPQYTYMFTNMDSILMNHKAFYSYDGSGGFNWIYMNAMQAGFYTSFDNSYLGGAANFHVAGGKVMMHRTDVPDGRAATVIAPSDITTINGVIHHVDNLLLPTP